MFDFLKKDKDTRVKNKIQLVSIHIPKTAGTSFRNTLKQVYGEDEVKRVDISYGKFKIEKVPFESDHLDKQIKVVHGHIIYELLIDKVNVAKDVPIITWLRDPLARVISNYKYLSKRLAEELDEEGKGLNILEKMQRSLIEYAHDEINRNRMSKFLKGIKPEELDFIGITEYYSEDLNYLSESLAWGKVKEFKVNITGKKTDDVSEEEKAIIRQLNQDDEKLYQKALELRSIRMSK